ncbi:thiamine diphosphokinase [Paenibacillus piri]|uniref:Thiamine diphosphokinase n=1 Tax=Paenibacillus piri TaxID=2547395 RepID=A0A4R5KPC8_9BACL|nr:thiamine diphosphokinase [Paenibacillus piri]TDF97162.1 thiamine diphosphokinase [Paenibacillus piri]
MDASSRIVIFSGGRLGVWALRMLKPEDFLIGADAGALFLIRQGLSPDVALGDFDSVTSAEAAAIKAASKQYIDCDPVMKDWTDTEMAFQYALDRRPSEIVMCGVLGTRWDHSLANLHLLRKGVEAGVRCTIVDEHNEIAAIDGWAPWRLKRGRYPHVSLLPLSLEVTGITLEGFQYPLKDAALSLGQSLGISNVLLEPEGTITISGGLLLVIQSGDDPPPQN